MEYDTTETARRELVRKLNSEPGNRASLKAKHGQVWDTDELRQDFDVKGFLAPFVIVQRKSDQVLGSLMFQHEPRLYFRFAPD
jgi:hypothetical protein